MRTGDEGSAPPEDAPAPPERRRGRDPDRDRDGGRPPSSMVSWTLALPAPAGAERPGESVGLPEPEPDSGISVESALRRRRSVRDFTDGVCALTLPAVGQLLWAAQGLTDRGRDLRAAPSAGARYPLRLYLAAGNVEDLSPGVYRYAPRPHALRRVGDGDRRDALSDAALSQRWVRDASAVLVLAADPRPTEESYGDRARRYVDMEAGAAAENIYLQATSCGLGTAAVGAFRDDRVRELLGLPETHRPLLLMPVGRPGGPSPG